MRMEIKLKNQENLQELKIPVLFNSRELKIAVLSSKVFEIQKIKNFLSDKIHGGIFP